MKENGKPVNRSYLDTSIPFTERVKDLVRQLTLEEKVGLMSHTGKGIPRLNIPAYNYWSEALHGVARNGVQQSSAGHWHGRYLGQRPDPSRRLGYWR